MIKPPIIIGGCPRSGTTLLRTMIDSHPNIYSGPELSVTMAAAEAAIQAWKKIGERAQNAYGLEDGDFAVAYGKSVKHILEKIRQKSGKSRVADKMPQSIQHFNTLCWMLPESPMIHIIRDGRDVCCSLLERYDLFHDETGKLMNFCQEVKYGAQYWKWIVQRGLLLRNHPCSDRYYELYYENLIENPEKEMRRLLEFIEEPWDDAVLNHTRCDHDMEIDKDQVSKPVNNNSVGRWERELSSSQVEEIMEESKDLLQYLGYVPGKIPVRFERKEAHRAEV